MIILTILITHALTLLTLYIGYLFGKYSYDKSTPKLPNIKRLFKKPVLGAIPKLTQAEIEKRGTRLEQTEQEMTKTLDEIFLDPFEGN